MTNKFCFLFLSTLLLVQSSWAVPVPASSSEEIGGNLFKAAVERLKLLEITVDGLVEVHKVVLEKGKDVFKKVLEDPNVLEVKTEAMEGNIKRIQKFSDQIEKDDTESKIFEILDEFGEIVNKYSKEKNDNLSEEEEIIQKSLEENGLTDLRTAIKESYKKFFDNFISEAENYIEGLSEKEKQDEGKLITWIEKLKAETDIEKQFDLFDDFFKETTADSSSSESSE